MRRTVALRSPRFGIINDPITDADVQDIPVDEEEYRDLRDCKIGDCNFKLPASTMRQFAQQVDWKSPAAKRQVDSLVRADVRGFVSSYRATGNAAMLRYYDTRDLVSVRRYRFDNLPSGGFLNIRGRARNALTVAFAKQRRLALGARPWARHTKMLGRPLRTMRRFAHVIQPTLETRVETLVVTAQASRAVQ